ncbi:MAG: DsrE family protein [Elusimicrobiales bacterium]|nr:DsrE family protein [Elusimicrobiales bacterium]
MMDNADKIVYVVTHFKDSPEKAIIPFVLANATYAMDAQPVIIVQGEGVNLAVKGKAADINHAPFDPLEKLFALYAEQGGQLLVCSPCLKARNYDEKDLVANAKIVGAAKVIEEVTSAKTVLSY